MQTCTSVGVAITHRKNVLPPDRNVPFFSQIEMSPWNGIWPGGGVRSAGEH
jgi:hypothetical protein